MIEFFAEYGLFLLKAITIVGAIVIVVGTIAAAGRKAARHEGLEIEHLNKKYQSLGAALKQAVSKKADWKAHAKQEKEKPRPRPSLATRGREVSLSISRATSRRLQLHHCAKR
jgi:serine protease SohB